MNKRRAWMLRIVTPWAYRWFHNHTRYRKQGERWANAISGGLVFSPLIVLPLGFYLNGQRGVFSGVIIVLAGIVPLISIVVGIGNCFSVDFPTRNENAKQKLKTSGLTKHFNRLSDADVWFAQFLPTLEEAAWLKQKHLDKALPSPSPQERRPRF